jgi:hypothetical protein
VESFAASYHGGKNGVTGVLTDEFLLACDSRVAKKDLAFVTAQGYRKLLAQIWRPEIGPRIFDEIRYSELAKIANAYSPEFGSSLAVGKCPSDSSLRNDSKIKWRRGCDPA